MDALAGHLGRVRTGLTILDLGAGTGRFSTMLADAFDARVVGVDDYDRRLHSAYRAGRTLSGDTGRLWTDALPAAEGEFDFALLSMVIHHVTDVVACVRELHRVVKPDGLVFIRNVFSGRLDGVRHYEFFPSARAIDEARLPTVERVRDAFVAAGFELVALDTLEQEIDVSLSAHYERLKLRALSTFELISDAEFEAGLARLRAAADRETAPTPVLESIDLLTLRRPG